MRVYAGTSGFSYDEWEGVFYPEGLKSTERLAHYAGLLPAVEVNNTFYRIPKKDVVASWRESVPEDFRFVLKASRRITHFKRLKEAGEELEFMLGQFAVLEDRLGAILFQIHPNLRKDVSRLETFLDLVPQGTRAAFQFRHESWFDEEVASALDAHGFVFVGADDEGQPAPALLGDAGWGYLRLRRAAYEPEELDRWRKRIEAQGWKNAFVFFKHEDEGAGPRMAASFLERCAAG